MSSTASLLAARSVVLSCLRVLVVALGGVGLTLGAPTTTWSGGITEDEEAGAKPPNDPTLWIYLSVAVFLVLLGGVFAGLTIALMGQDDVNLQVIHASGEGAEKRNAGKVLRLLKRGKHWVLVTLLLGNVITNETLPIVLDRSLGGGWPAVLGSTVLIVIFGEIIPQSICVRYGLPIGAWMSPLVLILMYVMAPAAWPTAKLLDWLLGEDHGTVYKKAGLKTLVGLHKTLGTSPQERLNQDEVTIISAVLDLKDKTVGSIMTPMDDVFTMSEDDVLDEKTMDVILSQGYSRIPIHAKDNDENFVGMLLVKILITYDPEDGKRVRDFALATLPETRPEASCLDIVNYFQEGKSHMVLVSDSPGEDYGALGVVTLEDVIEELIGEEIIDESDVFVDVHKAIRRLTPAQQTRLPRRRGTADRESIKAIQQERNNEETLSPEPTQEVVSAQADSKAQAKSKASKAELSSSPKTTFVVRRRSSLADGSSNEPVLVRSNAPDMREALKHLGPSNLASRPKQTRSQTVKIKQSADTFSTASGIESAKARPNLIDASGAARSASFAVEHPPTHTGGVGEGLLTSAGTDAKDGVQALNSGYGTIDRTATAKLARTESGQSLIIEPGTPEEQADSLAERRETSIPRLHISNHDTTNGIDSQDHAKASPGRLSRSKPSGSRSPRSKDRPFSPLQRDRAAVRSGSITENVIEAGGIRKVILDMTSSSSSDSGDSSDESRGAALGGQVGGGVEVSSGRSKNGTGGSSSTKRPDKAGSAVAEGEDDEERGQAGQPASVGGAGQEQGGKSKRKRRRRRGNRGKGGSDEKKDDDEESTPLLDRR